MLISFEELSRFFINPPRGVIHIGAHEAEELDGYLNLGIDSIIWVEANPKLFDKLKKITKKHAGSTVHCFAAHSSDDGVLELNIANNGQSSSILELGTHKHEHPHVHYIEKIKVPTKKVDSLIEELKVDKAKFDFINIDIQGAELLALKGMQKQLECARFLYLEVNEKPLYEGCALIEELDSFLADFSFTKKVVKMTPHGWGDALYVKDSI